MIPKRVPCELRKQTVVLVGILSIVRKDEVWGNRLELFEDCFHVGAHKRHKSVLECLEQWSPESSRSSKQSCRALRLSGTISGGTEHHPMEHAICILLG